MQPWQAMAGARLFDLAHPMRTGMPQSPNHPPFRMVLERRHGDLVRADGGSAANELIITGGHVGTHVDALAHVSHDGMLHGGVPAESVQTNRGLTALGIDAVRPYVGRCVLLDVAKLHGSAALAPGYEVSAEDLDRAEQEAGVRVGAGEAVFIGTGWSRHWSDGPRFTGQVDGAPGPGTAAAQWLIDKRVRLAGAETIAFECIPPGRGHAQLPVHRMLLVEAGINIVETLRLDELLDSGVREFLLMLSPLPIVGATGSPVRPLAMVAS